MNRPRVFLSVCFWLLAAGAGAALGRAETNPRWAKVSLFAQAAQRDFGGGEGSFFSELIGTVAVRSEAGESGGLEYALDARVAGYPSSEARKERISIYDAYLGWRTKGRAFAVRAGHVWLNEIGGLGSLAGVAADLRLAKDLSGLGTLKLGVFGGFEPKILEAGYVPGIKKFGGYLSLDGPSARRHVIGYVSVRNHDLTERSVLTFSNYVPVRRSFFLYQAAEYDLQGPAGRGKGRLTYFFTNARFSPVAAVEVQGTYHRGRSIDTRTIAEYVQTGRPVSESALEGFLFESLGGRLTVRPLSSLHVFVGYAQDRTDLQEEKRSRINAGFFSSDLFRTGFDVRASLTRYQNGADTSSNSWSFSLGRSLSRAVYLEGFYYSSVAFFRVFGSAVALDKRPRTDLFGLSSIVHLTRRASFLVTLERTKDDYLSEFRAMSGITYRF